MNSSTPSHRVLVVDDEPNIADVVSMALRYQGFTVETAADGRSAPGRNCASSHFCRHGELSASCWVDPSMYVKITVVVHSPLGGQTGGVRK